ncbi:MAG TPA: cobalt-precorrin 5A hydrolase [Anaerovoracaceae bacterium]|nr:cobalt-precorrin 5A hydrolase [Anaerovoracaceae bacterium]
MKAALISFTGEGANTCGKIEAGLTARGWECSSLPLKGSLDEWTAAAFSGSDALIFVGACGIAVRAIAPHIRDKTVDPAVVAVDEKGKYAIPLLSGHLGGANDLAREIAGVIGAEPVITTATDLNQRFAVDVWAKRNRLQIEDMKFVKEISAAILKGEAVGVSSDAPIEGDLPEGLRYFPDSETLRKKQENAGTVQSTGGVTTVAGIPKIGFRISVDERDCPFEKTLRLIPRTVTVGIGCRKGISPAAVEGLLDKVLKQNKLSVKSIEKICTIDIKKEEVALKLLAATLGVPLQVFSAEELEQLPGEFASSEFVSRITGVDNICERAAVLGSRGELIAGKQALNGVTVALAVRKEGYTWKES